MSSVIDQFGCFVSPKPHIANVEENEIHGPMLFLYRSYFPDTGGDGAHRGGRAAGTAWTPHGVDRLRCSLTSHGVDVPVSFGQFGGWPGVCSAAMVVHGSDVRQRWADGELPLALEDISEPLDLDALGGEVQVLEAKEDEMPVLPGDVVQYTWQGGGGYGDPLQREVEEVECDIRDGIISAARAETVYGVVPGESAREIEMRRERLRKSRLETADVPANAAGTRAPGQLLTQLGSGLVVARTKDGAMQFECSCGHSFCDSHDNWKTYAATHSISADELPSGMRVHPTLELVEYLCPSCGRRHALDVKERDEPVLQDLKVLSWSA